MASIERRTLVLATLAVAVVGVLLASASPRKRRRLGVRRCPNFDIMTVSAPGKVLITGGYLVLERPNSGIVLATTARFHCTAKLADAVQAPGVSGKGICVIVESPQFHASYAFWLSWPAGATAPPSLFPLFPTQEVNPFVELALVCVFSAVRQSSARRRFSRLLRLACLGKAIALKLRADNDFYSQTEQLRVRNKPVNAEELADLPQFLPVPLVDGRAQVAKTGLGSSAAMTSALVGCLLRFLGAIPDLPGGPRWEELPEERQNATLAAVHNLAQLCHAAAQGKVGSGFDVSAAVYGSQVYTRFSPQLAQAVLDLPTDSLRLPRELAAAVDADWDAVRTPMKLPQPFQVLMGDVAGGSATPGMVKGILAWRRGPATAEAAATLWAALSDANGRTETMLAQLSAAAVMAPAEFERCAAAVARAPLSALRLQDFAKGTVQSTLILLRLAFQQARRLLRQMGAEAGVEIEPPRQERLADATAALPGVLCAGVPGAGGVDAIFAVVVHETAAPAVRELWAGWGLGGAGDDGAGGGAAMVCPLLLSATEGPGLAVNEGLAW